MIPLKDENPSRSFPFVTIGLILANVAAFLYENSLPPRALDALIRTYGAVPATFGFGGSDPVIPGSAAPYLTLLTSTFLHGGLMHLIGNMLYLWVFGDNVEDSIGHLRYLIFYMVNGAAAALLQIAVHPASTIPLVGASGAIAGILGAYALLFPGARVLTLIFLFFFVRIVPLPALLLLGLWFLLQVLSAPMSQGAGVAFFAHIGGFLCGLLLALPLSFRRRRAGTIREG